MTDAAAANLPGGLRRVAIDPVSRVEGHGKVTILLDAQGRVHQARLHIVEFRGFEKFIEGRPYWEVPVMVQRLCGICPVSHHLAASKALDSVVGALQVTPSAHKLRELMHYGQVLQSHALHFFHLASPDLLFGFDSEAGRRNIIGVAQAYPEIARKGVLLRKFGQQVVQATAGKRVHGTGSVPGGMNKHLSPEDRDALAHDLPPLRAWAEDAVALVQRLHAQDPALYDGFACVPTGALSLVGPSGEMALYHGAIRARDVQGHITLDSVPDQRYHDIIEEELQPWTYMKFPYLRQFGAEQGWYRVGPLARIQNCDAIATPRAEHHRQAFLAHGDGRPVHATLAFHWARMIELLHCVEMIERLLDDPDLLAGELMAADPARAPRGADGQREGVGVIEAPRGTLIHHYRVGDDDLVTMCNLIVATTHNNRAMNEAVRQVCREYLEGHEITEGLLNRVEVAIRAFDPCLSCATHAIGRMPLDVALCDADGAVIERVLKSHDGQLLRAPA